MKRKKLAALLLAVSLFAIPALGTQVEALSLGGALGKVVKQKDSSTTSSKKQMPKTGEVVYSGAGPTELREKEFEGHVYLPDGSPAPACRIYGTENLIYRIYKGNLQIRSRTDSRSNPLGWTGDPKNLGWFSMDAEMGKTYTFIFFQEGYKPVILKDVTLPAKRDVHFTETDDTIKGSGFVGYFPESDAIPY